MARALITGITGQDGLYLAELLLGKGYEVYGLVRGQNNPKVALVREAVPDVHVLTGDLTDMPSLMAALATSQPDEVYNLGAISYVAYSWQNARITTDVTGAGVLNMLEAVRLHAGDDPGRVPEFVTRKVSQAVARISLGLQDELVLGNLEARRDWGFAGDYVDAMWRMLQQDEADDYVVSTGATHSIRELLDAAFGHVGIDDWSHLVRTDPQFVRPAEVDLLVGDASKARERLGWEPTVDFRGLVAMMVEHDLAEQRRLAA